MSSPIHSYLFSPPASPPHRASDLKSRSTTEAHGLTPLKSLVLPLDFTSRASLDDSSMMRSPRTPQQRHFQFDRLPGSPSLYSRPTVIVDDVEASPRTPRVLSFDDPITPKASDKASTLSTSVTYAPNVPSTSVPLSMSLPRPLLRLLFLGALVVSCVILVAFVPSARLPSLASASTSRRLALASDGRAYYDVANAVSSWEEAKERDYTPPQVRVPNLRKRTASSADRISAAPPVVTRPYAGSRLVPNSHELLAVQSYILQSAYNLLPLDRDSAMPLYTDAVLSFSAHKLGEAGSDAEKAWLKELEQEAHDDIVVWYGGDGNDAPPHALLDVLAALHGPKRRPHLIPVKNRPDLHVLHAVLDRQSLTIRHEPLLMIGNTPIPGNLEGLEELRSSGKLREMLISIGWLKEEPKRAVRPIKKATWKKRELTEVEDALKLA